MSKASEVLSMLESEIHKIHHDGTDIKVIYKSGRHDLYDAKSDEGKSLLKAHKNKVLKVNKVIK